MPGDAATRDGVEKYTERPLSEVLYVLTPDAPEGVHGRAPVHDRLHYDRVEDLTGP